MSKIKEIWKNTKLRNKILFTLAMLAVYRLGSDIPVPGINQQVLHEMFQGENMGLFEIFNLFTGGSFANFTVFALGVTPYITASIITQLFTIAVPSFEKMSQEGDEGRKKMASITRYMTIGLALIQGAGMAFGLFRNAIISEGFYTPIVIVFILTAGTAFLMWLGEQINQHGVGNGISLIIFAGIASRIPSEISSIMIKVGDGKISIVTLIVMIIAAVAIIAGVIEIQQGIRKVPLQYSQRVVGRKAYGGQSTHLPIKVNTAGVIPIIFAMAMLQFPLTFTYFFPESGFTEFCNKFLSPVGTPGMWIYSMLNVGLIIFFTYFYTSVMFKPKQVAKSLKNSGGAIPGVRPGIDTETYLKNVSNRLCFVGAIFLAVVSTMPIIIKEFTPIDFMFGGTSLLILVGVALDTAKQIENRTIMERHKGFLA